MTGNAIKVTLVVLVLFFLLFGGFGFYFMSRIGTVQKEESLEKELQKLRDEKRQILEDNVKLTQDIGDQEVLIDKRRVEKEVIEDDILRLRVARGSFKTNEDARRSHSENVQAAERRVSSALEGGGEENAPTIQALRSKKDEFEVQYRKRRDDLQNNIDDITKESTKQTLKYQGSKERKRKERDRNETSIVQIREELQKFMVRDLPDIDMGHDGVVLTMDIESRQAVINAGKRQGIKCGMRFEVFQFRQGIRRVHKGYLAVRSVGRETASCIILNMAIRLPRCPGGGYTARYPEERFCPYCTGSAGGARVQRLSAIPQEVNLGMDPENPIVAGDLIHNPLYEPGRKLHFAVKGEAESSLAREWKTEDFIAAIKWHGGVVDADLTAGTDVLLAGKYAMDATRMARELGIRILRQYEVFNFLRQ